MKETVLWKKPMRLVALLMALAMYVMMTMTTPQQMLHRKTYWKLPSKMQTRRSLRRQCLKQICLRTALKGRISIPFIRRM